ncbi:MAG: tetratricopeptide repeat protein [Chthoniobacterales bacterium]
MRSANVKLIALFCLMAPLCLNAQAIKAPSIQEYKKDIKTDALVILPMEARFYAEKGNTAFSNGDLKAAKTNYEKVISLAPDNVLGLVNLGVVYYHMKEYKAAEDTLIKAVSRQLKTSAAWMTMGLMYMDLGRMDEAFAALSFAAIYDPKNARLHNYLGVAAGNKGWYDAAESELRKALELDPKLSEANFNLAVFYMERKPPAIELARRHYQRAIELGAEHDPALEKNLEKK